MPYGIAEFRRIRREGMVYLDRTAHVRDLEALGSVLVCGPHDAGGLVVAVGLERILGEEVQS